MNDDDEYDDEEMSRYARRSDDDTSHDAARGSRRSFDSQKSKLARVYEEVYPEALIPYEAGLKAGLVDNKGRCHWHRVTDLDTDGVTEKLADTELCTQTGKQQHLHRWVPPDQRLSPEALERRRQPGVRSPQMTSALVVVGEVRDEMEVIGKRSATAQGLADRLTAALATAPGFTDWRQDDESGATS